MTFKVIEKKDNIYSNQRLAQKNELTWNIPLDLHDLTRNQTQQITLFPRRYDGCWSRKNIENMHCIKEIKNFKPEDTQLDVGI